METAERTIFLYWVVATVGVWWVANTIATIASKSVMKGDDISAKGTTGWTSAFEDLRWVDLTALQHLIGSVISVLLVKLKGKPVWPSHARGLRTIICVAALGNVIGNLTTNAAYALITSSSVQVVKACEPLFTFMLTVLLYRDRAALDVSNLLSVAIIVVGAGTFLTREARFNIWGIGIGMISNTAFPIRNIFLKKLSEIWDSPLQKYAVISIFSVFFLLPALVVKVFINQEVAAVRLSESLISGVFHCTYNLASIEVLERFSPVTHALLNISKRLFVVMTNIMYFHTPISWNMVISLAALVIGCYLYQMKSSSKKTHTVMKGLILFAFAVYSLQNKLEPPSQVIFNPNKHVDCGRISTAWVYDKPIPNDLALNIEALSARVVNLPVHVYCGTTQCVDAIAKLNNTNIAVEFLVASNIVKNTSLERWIAHHPFNKVLAGKEFETHLQEVVRLGLLWNYGGFYIDPMVRVTDALKFISKCSDLNYANAVVTKGVEVPEGSVLQASFFPRKHHPFIGELAERFDSEYPTGGYTSAPMNFSFQETIWTIINDKLCRFCPFVSDDVRLKQVPLPSAAYEQNYYGTLSYNTRAGVPAYNLGDEMQCFPGLQYLPFVDNFVERDKLKASSGNNTITAFFNAYWAASGFSWPPPSNIDPILLSLHIDSHQKILNRFAQHIEYLKEREPIGSRDYGSLNFLKEHGVKAFFSGCLTLLLKNPNVDGQRTEDIYITDVRKGFIKLLPKEIQDKAIQVVHRSKSKDNLVRFTEVYERIRKYASAKLVITQRIHCALPCVAMGTPVIFINSPGLPGGSAAKTSPRTAGLTPLFHTLDSYTLSGKDVKNWLGNFSWHNIPPNPNANMLMRLRATFWNVIRGHQALSDAAKKFGVIPMSLPPIQTQHITFLFHLIFTTNESPVSLLAQGTKQCGFNWRHMRSIESIFHHHPTAEVIVHSRTLPHDTFDVLTEAGYTIKVQNYDLEKLLKGSPAESFASKLEEAKKGRHWYSHQTDLLRLLVLYLWGGTYMDMDAILVRPIDSLSSNTVGFQSPRRDRLGGAFMSFEKNNSYLKSCLQEFANTYDENNWERNGYSLLTHVWRQYYAHGNNDVITVDHRSFFMFNYKNIMLQCFEQTSGVKFESNMEVLKVKAYAVHLYSSITGHIGIQDKLNNGTICSHLLNSFCVLCNDLH